MCFKKNYIGKIFFRLICITLMTICIYKFVRIIDINMCPVNRDKLIMVSKLEEHGGEGDNKAIVNIHNNFASKEQLQLGASIILSLAIYVSVYCRYQEKIIK